MVSNYLKTLDSGFRRNDGKWYFLTFYETIKFSAIVAELLCLWKSGLKKTQTVMPQKPSNVYCTNLPGLG